MLFRSDYADLELGLPKYVDVLPRKYLDDGKKWLKTIFEYWQKEIYPIWRLLTPEIWARYKRWKCFDDHRECMMLQAKLPAFKKLIKSEKRAMLFKKGKINGVIEKKLRKEAGPADGAATQPAEISQVNGTESGASQ